jgi:hypothetical protein
MNEKRYWFPVRPARNGWGWGLPLVWQGWVVYLVYFAALIGGIIIVAPHGPWFIVAYSCSLAALLLGVMLWKGEPQRMRDKRSP